MVMLDEPLGAHQGGSVAAPVFNLVAQVALGDFLVQPDEKGFREALISLSNKYESKATEEDSVTGDVIAQVQPEPSPTVTPEPRTQTAPNNAKPKAPELNVSANPAPSELAARRTPPKPTPTPAPKPSGPTSVMPDVRGRGLRAVTQVCTQLNLNPKLMGSGVAFRQTPAPGARVRPGEDCKVEFQ